MGPLESDERAASGQQRIAAESMPQHLPGMPRLLPARPQLQDTVMQLYSHHTVTDPVLVPAVVEPLLVLVLAGSARVEGAFTRRAMAGGRGAGRRLLPDQHQRTL